MRCREEDMYLYVRKNLRRRYPKYDGWEISHKDRREGYEPDFVVERKGRQIERVVVEVKKTYKATTRDVNQLNGYVKNLSGGNTKIVNKILVVPSRADTSDVPSDIKVMFLKRFRCK